MKSNEYHKARINPLAITRDLRVFDRENNNIYKTIAILSKRANQIALDMNEEFKERVKEFEKREDIIDEVFENKEQIELARFYEHLPKPTILAIHEFENDKIFYRDPEN